MEDIQHSIFSCEGRRFASLRTTGNRMLVGKSSRFIVTVSILFSLVALLEGYAQTPPQISAQVAAQMIMRPQPAVDSSQLEAVSAKVEFDPPTVSLGQKSFYRVTINATENSIHWPNEICLPPELLPGLTARGQLTQPDGVPFHPLTEFIYSVTPTAAGRHTVSNYLVSVGGSSVEIPSADLEVVAATTNLPSPRILALELSATNVFLGQPFRVQVLLPAGAGNQIEALRDIQLSGGGLMIDKTALSQSIDVANINGQLKQSFICELKVTPIAMGPQEFFAQGFTAGREFSGPITMHGQLTIPGGPAKYVLLVSEPVKINVRPLPIDSEPPGFTGTMGTFFSDPPQLSTNRLHLGEPIHLKIMFHGKGDLTRFVAPAPPRSHDWQIIADYPPNTGFTLIPQTDETQSTPAIPFSGFDPIAGKYYDLSIPPLPVTVIGEGLPTELPTFDDDGKSTVPVKLSNLAPLPGKTATSLKPLQLQGWFVCLQLVPIIGFIALWRWDNRRRFLEAHPEIVRRRQALRALRRERLKLQKALDAGDADAFVRHAADALCIAVAPHYPANPQALVCADVLAQLDGKEQNGHHGETVRKIFAAADTRFGISMQTQPDLPALQADVETLLRMLEEKL